MANLDIKRLAEAMKETRGCGCCEFDEVMVGGEQVDFDDLFTAFMLSCGVEDYPCNPSQKERVEAIIKELSVEG